MTLKDDVRAIAQQIGQHGSEQNFIANPLFAVDNNERIFLAIPVGKNIMLFTGVLAIHTNTSTDAPVVLWPPACIVAHFEIGE